jgi:3-oxoacyl-[acyl-carrier protein] reductase
VITGGTRGIGRAVALRLAQDGYTLILNYAHDDEQAKEALTMVQNLSPQSIVVKADVTDESGAKRLLQQASVSGPISLWVNNVGDFLLKPFLEITLKEWQEVLRSNLTSAFLCCKTVVPHMRAHKSGQIINIGMMHAEIVRAVPNTVPYTIAKAGLLILTKSLASSEGRYGIRVNAVNPGFIEKGAYSLKRVEDMIPLGRTGHLAEVAAAVSFLASEEASYITGAILNVHGGAYL